jgi:oligoendopeptidase F
MAAFAKRAFDERWIEAEDRPKKAPGGFCTAFPLKKETRIFMTYANTFSNLSTLAHELGHAFHSHVCFDLPILAGDYRMNVAETASTMAEMIVIDAALKQQIDPSIKLGLLNDKIQRSIAFLMNIHARFIFETDFYAERKKGYVLPETLCALMLAAQKRAYLNALAEWHPYFWASKMHFYFTDIPFYNFPYTFGYLFSLGIYTHLKQKKNSEEMYIALLKDTGKMPTRELAKKHLQVDLEKAAFWEDAMHACIKDVSEFLTLCEKIIH